MRIHLTAEGGNTVFRYGIKGDKYFCIIKLDYSAPCKYTQDIFVSYHAATASLRLYTENHYSHIHWKEHHRSMLKYAELSAIWEQNIFRLWSIYEAYAIWAWYFLFFYLVLLDSTYSFCGAERAKGEEEGKGNFILKEFYVTWLQYSLSYRDFLGISKINT